jgi:hypothetical protein
MYMASKIGLISQQKNLPEYWEGFLLGHNFLLAAIHNFLEVLAYPK